MTAACRLPAGARRRHPRAGREIAEQGNGGQGYSITVAEPPLAVLERETRPARLLHRHQRDGTDGGPHRASVGAPVPDEAPMPRGADPDPQPGNPCVPDDVFRPSRFQPGNARIRQANRLPRRHVELPASTGARASTASRTEASDRWAYLSVVVGLSCPSRRPTARIDSPLRRAMLAYECLKS